MQVYVDDIIFGSINEPLYQEFVPAIQEEFEMSMMGEVNYFLGLQIKQMKNGMLRISQDSIFDEVKQL